MDNLSNSVLDVPIDDLYRKLSKEYEQQVGKIEYAFENPVLFRKIKRKTVHYHKVISTKDDNKIIDFESSEEIIVELGIKKGKNDYNVVMGKAALYNISLDTNSKICEYYEKNKKHIKDIHSTYNGILAAIAFLNLPVSVAGIISAIIVKIGVEKYCQNAKNVKKSKRPSKVIHLTPLEDIES